MKKVALLFLFIGSVSYAQIIDQNQEQRQAILDAKKNGIYIGFAGLKKPTIFKSSYMILIEERDKLSKRVNITFDFGQESGFFLLIILLTKMEIR